MMEMYDKVASGEKWYVYTVYIGALACVPVIMLMVSNIRYTEGKAI